MCKKKALPGTTCRLFKLCVASISFFLYNFFLYTLLFLIKTHKSYEVDIILRQLGIFPDYLINLRKIIGFMRSLSQVKYYYIIFIFIIYIFLKNGYLGKHKDPPLTESTSPKKTKGKKAQVLSLSTPVPQLGSIYVPINVDELFVSINTFTSIFSPLILSPGMAEIYT